MATFAAYGTGHSEFSMNSFPAFVLKFDYTVADLVSLKYKIVVPTNMYIIAVGHEVLTAFSGGTPDVLVGTATDDNAYITTGACTLSSVGDYVLSSGLSGALAGGKKVAQGDQIVVLHAASIAAGAGRVHVIGYSMDENWRNAGLI